VISGQGPEFPPPLATAMTSHRPVSRRKRAERMARDLECATSKYVRPLLEPGEELLDCAPGTRFTELVDALTGQDQIALAD
jgi:hypothetical protein